MPFDSRATPPLPKVWSNSGAGGISLFKNGSVTAFTGTLDISGRKGRPIVLQFSMLVTPVRPLDLKKHYGERYAQLGGPQNYTFLAEQGATVVNMHQGNAINPWINYPYVRHLTILMTHPLCFGSLEDTDGVPCNVP